MEGLMIDKEIEAKAKDVAVQLQTSFEKDKHLEEKRCEHCGLVYGHCSCP